MNRRYRLNFTIIPLCTVLFFVPFVVASLPNPNDTYILTLDASDRRICNTTTLWDILLNCSLTLFVFTLTATHPNITGVDDEVVSTTTYRLCLMYMALFFEGKAAT
ncbi:hypothetical protein BDR03DRAFT_1018984 [Suillus americanus]|nr:hypothetical protein BDR03DRAFT_1018984 [Suillus americanus]